jgi:hypothetical protein
VIVQAYFLLLTGRQYFSSISLRIRVRERYAVPTLAALILLGGLMPQIGLLSRDHAADEILKRRLNSRPDLVNADVRTTSPDHEVAQDERLSLSNARIDNRPPDEVQK